MTTNTFHSHAQGELTLLGFLTALKTQMQGMVHTDLAGRIVAYAETTIAANYGIVNCAGCSIW